MGISLVHVIEDLSVLPDLGIVVLQAGGATGQGSRSAGVGSGVDPGVSGVGVALLPGVIGVGRGPGTGQLGRVAHLKNKKEKKCIKDVVLTESGQKKNLKLIL